MNSSLRQQNKLPDIVHHVPCVSSMNSLNSLDYLNVLDGTPCPMDFYRSQLARTHTCDSISWCRDESTTVSDMLVKATELVVEAGTSYVGV